MTTSRFLEWSAGSRRLSTLLYFLVLNWLMLAPASAFEDVQEFLPQQDKLVHGASFLILGSLVRWSLPARQGRGRRLVVFAALTLYAGAIEALQPVLGGSGRQFDWLDLAGNLCGVCAGWLLMGWATCYTEKSVRGGTT